MKVSFGRRRERTDRKVNFEGRGEGTEEGRIVFRRSDEASERRSILEEGNSQKKWLVLLRRGGRTSHSQKGEGKQN